MTPYFWKTLINPPLLLKDMVYAPLITWLVLLFARHLTRLEDDLLDLRYVLLFPSSNPRGLSLHLHLTSDPPISGDITHLLTYL